jgi:hypothetical protein
MGRKPNQLILEFFERGPKLEDSSNRYQHTCKACGEKFPKGRIDSLQTHLVKKCPAISLRDRQKALLQLNDLPDLPESRNGAGLNGPTVELPVGSRNWTSLSKLETLAEVSRQIHMSEKQDVPAQADAPPNSQGKPDETPRLERFELQEQWTPENPPLSYDARVQREKKRKFQPDDSQIASNAIAVMNQRSSNRRDSEATLPLATFASTDPLSPTSAATLSMATAKSMADAASRFVPSMLDPALLGEGLPELPQGTMPLEAHAQEAQAWPMLDGSGGNMYPEPNFENPMEHPRSDSFTGNMVGNPGIITQFSAEFGDGQRPNKPKVRGRFTPQRRKEVQEVRKRGACIRCRMLKKPCSGGDPCSTCRNVESARLWKQPCIRTRIADELDMYNSALNAVPAFREISALKARVPLAPSRHMIEASHYPESTIFASFKSLEGHETLPEQNIDPSLGLGHDMRGQMHYQILDSDADDLPTKVEAYMKRMSSIFFEKEPSHFMNVTLSTAVQLSIEKQDAVLSKTLELWCAVHILVDPESRWTIFEKATHEVNGIEDIGAVLASETAPLTPIKEDTTTYQLIRMQLEAAVEKKASMISRSLLTEMERRLLQRNSTSAFETFLAALILLNCVEKSTWVYKSWEQDFLKVRWPLDKTPQMYGAQGDNFTDILQMLLRMRNIPPKTLERLEDGVLVCEGDDVARVFFEKLNLSCEYSCLCGMRTC